jgi:Domain of unknown function (DUF4157)
MNSSVDRVPGRAICINDGCSNPSPPLNVLGRWIELWKRGWRRVAHTVLLGSLSIITTNVLACPQGQYESLGMCWPEIGGAVGQGFEHLKKEIPAQLGGNPLEVWIVGSRNTSINGAQPIPPQIRQALTGYIEDSVMNIARFRIGDEGVLNLAGLTERYGDASAVTLIDVIVFRNANDAYNNASLWAHELTHVKQFRDWGVHNFAISYTRNYSDIENPAYAVGNGYAQWRASRGVAGPIAGLQQPWPPQPQGLPSGYGMLVCGCYGPTTGVAPESRCQSRAVRANMCGGFCPGGGSPYAWVCQ